MNRFTVVIILIMLSIGLMAQNNYVDVPSPQYPKIQDAIDYAETNPEILFINLSCGTYNETLKIRNLTHNITFRSSYSIGGDESVITNTIIQAPVNSNSSVVTIYDCNSSVTFYGVSITGGTGTYRGGSLSEGGGILCYVNSNFTGSQNVNLQYTHIFANSAGSGGGINSRSTNLSINNCSIFHNKLYGDDPEFPDLVRTGAGIYIFAGHNMINNSKIYNNDTFQDYNDVIAGTGGGIYWESGGWVNNQYYSSLDIYGCQIFNNKAKNNANSSLEKSSAIHAVPFTGGVNQHHFSLKNCTIVDNLCYDENFGPYNYAVKYGGYSSDIQNSIIYNNRVGSTFFQLCDRQLCNYFAPVRAVHCDINGVFNENYYEQYLPGDPSALLHNIDTDPLFVNESLNDYHLKWDADCISPCIDHGSDRDDIELPGNPIDIGALQFTDFQSYFYKYTLPITEPRTTYKWMSHPVLDNVRNNHDYDADMALYLFDGLWDPEILEWINWRTTNDGISNYLIYHDI